MTRANLDPSLRQAIRVGTPVEIVDATTNETFYLLSSDQFRAMSATISGDLDPREAYPLIEKLMAEDDANDPLLDSYQ
jgi:hypothetical protein